MADKLFPIMSVPAVGRFAPPFVPWEFMAPHEAQARQNHQQSLARLAERGGLDVTEALAVIEGRHWQALPIQQAGARFCAALKQWEETNGELGRLRARVAELEQRLARVAEQQLALSTMERERDEAETALDRLCEVLEAEDAITAVLDPGILPDGVRNLRAEVKAMRSEREHLVQGCAEAFVHLQWLERQRADMALHQVEWLRAHERYMARQAKDAKREAERWIPWAGTLVSFAGEPPEEVAELASDYGTVLLASGRWVAISLCRPVERRSAEAAD